MVLLIVVIIVFVILLSIYIFLYLDVKNNGTNVKAQVLGYFDDYETGIIQTSICMVLQFIDNNGITHTFAKIMGYRNTRTSESIIKKFKENSYIDIIYKSNENKYNDFQKRLIVLGNGKKVELTDDGRKFDIIYKSKRNNKTNLVKSFYTIIGFTIILLMILLIKTIIN